MIPKLWLGLGLAAQGMFTARFVVQWIVSERRKRSTVPLAFWYLSLGGGLLLLAYAIHRKDPVFILGQSAGVFVYTRNLVLLHRRRPSPALRRALPWVGLLAVAAVSAFAWQGSRGLTDPDEGRYAEVAREMIVSGDYVHPQLDFHPHFTKPPLTYWCIAASMRLFGDSEWAVRLFQSLAYMGTIFLVALTAAHLWNTAAGVLAGVVYASFATPFAGANIVTTDTLLTFWEALALFAYFRGRSARSRRGKRLWPLATGASFGLAFLTKGPPGLLFLLAILVYERFPAGRRGPEACRLLGPWGVLALLGVGFSWFVAVVSTRPELLGYFLGDEIVGRIAGHHHRNAGWAGPLVVYLPVLTLGALPWSVLWPVLWRRWRSQRPGVPAVRAVTSHPRALVLALLVLVPLVVLSLSRSRLPLYLLPLFVPLALGTARGLQLAAGTWRWRPRYAVPLGTWMLVLVLGRWAYAHVPQEADARRLFHQLPIGPTTEIVIPEGIRPPHGLAFYAQRDIEYVSWRPGAGVSMEDEAAEDGRPGSHPHLFLVRPRDASRLEVLLRSHDAQVAERRDLEHLVAILTRGGMEADDRPVSRRTPLR